MVLSNLQGVGKKTLLKIADDNDFASIGFEDLSKINPRIKKALSHEGALDSAKEKVDNELKISKEHDIKILCFADNQYPKLLNDTHDKPSIIYVKGEWNTDQDKSIAIIGTRTPTQHGIITATHITEYFAQEGWSIVSGLAIGCDAIAHNIALANGAHTIAVLPHGFSTIYPTQHKKLAYDILDKGGLLLSEYKYDTKPSPYQFVERDRIQAGLSQGVVMIQSELKGGSLHASRSSLSYNRLLAVPHATDYDIENNSDSVSANIIISSNNDKEKATLLKCDERQLTNIFIINDQSDYPDLIKKLSNK